MKKYFISLLLLLGLLIDCSMEMGETPRQSQFDLLLPYYLKYYFNK